MNTIREGFAAEVSGLLPVLHEAYRRIGHYQKRRTRRNEALLREALAEVKPALAFFKGLVPRRKRPYFDAILEEGLTLSDRLIALDVAVGAMHVEFPVERAYMHRESRELRRVLELSRVVEGEEPLALESRDGVLVRGIAASPGVVTGKVALIKRNSDYRRLPAGSIVVARMTRTDLMLGVERVSGIVTDLGGSLCHAAIIARELALPCVVGTGEATQRLTPGEFVCVNGDEGTVRGVGRGR